jgi:Protein of unknown function (DUF559)
MLPVGIHNGRCGRGTVPITVDTDCGAPTRDEDRPHGRVGSGPRASAAWPFHARTSTGGRRLPGAATWTAIPQAVSGGLYHGHLARHSGAPLPRTPLVLPHDAVFSHFTAAQLYGLPADDQLIHVSTSSPQRRPGPRIGVRLHESVSNPDVRTYCGLPITTPERTFVDLAPALELVDLVIFGDAMLRRGLTCRSSLREALVNAAGRRGVCRAREAAELMRDGVDSPMETRLRLLLVFAGLPCPEINADIFDEHGHWLSRPDLCYRGMKLALEYEGDTHRTDKRQWRADMTRHEVLHDLGWTVLRFHADDILLRPHRAVERVRYWINQRSLASSALDSGRGDNRSPTN